MNIKTGYYNWNEFGLKDSFYPDDMPGEWRLTFYANEIECTQISLDGLGDLDEAGELFEDLNEQFHLLVHCHDEKQWSLLNQLLENDEISIAALLINELSQKHWSEQLKKASIPCFFKSDEQSILFEKNVVGRQLLKDGLKIVYLDELLSLKQIRLFIEQWAKEAQNVEYYILLNASIYNSAQAGEIRLMIEMMGY